MKKIFILILFSILTASCSNKTQKMKNDLLFKELVFNSDELVIKLYDSAETKKMSRGIEKFAAKKTFYAIGNNKEKFNLIIKHSELTDYCCCPMPSYAISFFNKNKEIDIFYVDTLEFKNKIRIYQRSYQYSYIAEKSMWKNYLETIK